MKQKPSPRDLNRQEYRMFIPTGALAGLIIYLAILVNLLFSKYSLANSQRLAAISLGGALYLIVYSIYLVPLRQNKDRVMWFNAIISSASLLLMGFSLPKEFSIYFGLLALITIMSTALLAEYLPTLLVLLAGILPPALHWLSQSQSFLESAGYLGILFAAALVGETLLRIQGAVRQQIKRLETINAFSRQIASTLNRDEIFALLNAAIPKAVTSDSYYVGIQEEDGMVIPLFYDDGEYYNNLRVKVEGSLSGWVVRNQQELFLPDLRDPLDLEGVDVIVVGKEKASLSWIGVPLVTNRFKGLIALASYQPNAFNRGDIELLANLSQHVAMALENAMVHEEVEQRSRLDQMTGVLNHGAFLETLQSMVEEAAAKNEPLSLIMLDVDYFKNYNDTYGHLVGDQILNRLCDVIRAHIKITDAIGRWGGEEFIIALPGARGLQAHAVAERIRQTMNEIKIPGRIGEPIAAPTISQGISEFPAERNQIYDLIDLADQRLYTAKGRGRNQIEPAELFWVASS